MTLKNRLYSLCRMGVSFVILILGIMGITERAMVGEESKDSIEHSANKYAFGPVIERMVCDESAGKDMFVDFDTGKVTSPPEVPPNYPFETWLRKTGTDGMGAIGGRGNIQGLACWEMIVVPVDDVSWDDVNNASYFLQFFDRGTPGSPVFMTGKDELPVTYMFKTREGGIGILQIVGFNDKPKAVKIQYKMLQSSQSGGVKQNSNGKRKEQISKKIVLKVIGPDGEKLSGAKVYQHYNVRNGQRKGREYTCDKDGLVNLVENEVFQYEWERKGIVLYGLYEDKSAGFVNVCADDLGKEVTLKLTPACKVFGKIKSTELNDLGQKVDWANIYVYHKKARPLSYSSEQGDFEFLLPSGEYKLYAYGNHLYGKQEQVEVASKQKELEKNFDLPADRLTHLIGKEAPELLQIKGWLNSKKIKLANLRGKVVLLDFWGTWCGPCVVAIPELIDLHEKYHDRGLVIIGIHDDSMKSIKELEKKIGQLSEERWKGRKIPFAIALDGGGDNNIEGTGRTARGATTAAYGIQRWPTMVLIDKQGKVVKDYNHHSDIQLLEKLLADDIDNQP